MKINTNTLKSTLSIAIAIIMVIYILPKYINNETFYKNNIKTTNSLEIQEKLLRQAEAKGFQKGIIQHSLNTKWSDFGDRKCYSFVKTLKSGIKLYRVENTDMILEVYVQDGYIKIQSSNFILHDQTTQTLREMDAWLMSCKPTFVEGDINGSKIYNFNYYNVTLRNKDIGIHYMIACNANTPAIENKATIDIPLEKLFSNEYFSIKYPTSWQIVQDDNKITNQTSVSLQIIEKQVNNRDFRPNINIIVSGQKRVESAITLSNITISQNKQIMPKYQLLNKDDKIQLCNCQGCKIEQQFTIQGYKLRNIQYIVKKIDNTTYTITATTDANKYSTQILTLNQIINSLIIK